MNAIIMKKTIFHKMKPDLKGHGWSHEVVSFMIKINKLLWKTKFTKYEDYQNPKEKGKPQLKEKYVKTFCVSINIHK